MPISYIEADLYCDITIEHDKLQAWEEVIWSLQASECGWINEQKDSHQVTRFI